MYNLHAILLENDNVLIHISNKTSSSELFEECKNIYDFAKTNAPKCVIEYVSVNSPFAIDYYVKQYMSYYGIEHVRGGTYSHDVLSESQIAHIEQELHIETTMQQYASCETGQILENLKYYTYSSSRCEISRATLVELAWLKETIHFSKMVSEYAEHQGALQITFSDEFVAKYEKIIFLCNQLREKVLTLRDGIDCEYSEYLANPRKIFDRYIYYSASNSEIVGSYDCAIYMWGRFELMCYILINKIDELEFDIANP